MPSILQVVRKSKLVSVAWVTVFATLAALGPGSLGEAIAQTRSTTFNVSLTVLDECTITATDMAFGTVSVLAGGATATSTVTVLCTTGTDYAIGLSAGTGAGATVAARQMTGPGGATLQYTLYRDAARTLLWGNTTSTNTVDSAAATGAPETYTVYGQVAPAQTNVTPGAYGDVITATITYGASL